MINHHHGLIHKKVHYMYCTAEAGGVKPVLPEALSVLGRLFCPEPGVDRVLPVREAAAASLSACSL